MPPIELPFVLAALLASSSSAFLVKRKTLRPRRSTAKRWMTKNDPLTMYFDDVSRSSKYTISWHPSESGLLKGGGGRISRTEEVFRKKYAKEKAERLRLITGDGFTAESASMLSTGDVESEISSWVEKSGLVGGFVGEEGYESLSGISVCNENNLVACMAEFWMAVVQLLEGSVANPDEDASSQIERIRAGSLVLMAFPECSELYDYKTLSTLSVAIDYCKQLCDQYGKDFTSTLFHPKYKNMPKMIQYARHSPFPCLGFHLGEEDRSKMKYLESTSPNIEYTLNDSGAEVNYVPSLDIAKRDLEIMFNSAAASSDAEGVVSREGKERIPDDVAIEMTQSWIEGHQLSESPSPSDTSNPNRALRFADTIEDRWRVTDANTAEKMYAETWAAISALYDLGAAQEKATDTAIISLGLISTKYCAFNAQGFKRFAVTVNAALRRLTNEQMFLEMFHPEYAGINGNNDDLRRSPFATIQICYKVRL